ncbi:MAG: hypothetical protein LBQ48_00910 [Oscillospiraceae bacterium]|jgi:hypothetical protein|nr:hypothetical protein [Oscillospiraceae bacterium]
MTELFEAGMVIAFGISWPTSILKSYTSGTAKGKSVVFLLCILLGYVCGIASKLAAGNITYVFIFYVINFIMVSVDLGLFFRNRRLDAKRSCRGGEPSLKKTPLR